MAHVHTTIKLLVCIIFITAFSQGFELHILHSNDVHSHVEEFNQGGRTCTESDLVSEICYGGIARRSTAIKDIRSSATNTLLLDVGDVFTGTEWFSVFRGESSAHFMNLLNYTAMSLGKYDFIHGTEGLLPFLQDTNFPAIGSNINTSSVPSFNDILVPSLVVNMPGGEQLGIVGYSDDTIPDSFRTGELIFHDEAEALQREVSRLESTGINKIVALGYGGIEIHERIAENVKGVDIVVYGGPQTLLYNGIPNAPEDEDRVSGEYPMVKNRDDNSTVLLVTAYKWGKYLGHLKVSFTEDGNITEWSGNPVLLNQSIEQDTNILNVVDDWKIDLENGLNRVIGTTHVLLDGRAEICRLQECNLENLVMDATLHFYANKGFRNISLAMVNADSYDNYLEETGSGNITFADLLNVLLYDETMDIVEVEGRYLRQAFERSVENYVGDVQIGYFLQVSGARVTYDISKSPGNRVKELLINCATCRVPTYKPVADDEVYKFITNSYIASGGSGYSMIGDNRLSHFIGYEQADILEAYVTTISPIRLGVEDRIRFYEASTDPVPNCPVAGAQQATPVPLSSLILGAILFLILQQ
ncbi:snake venom 5'-nucleotidase-like [Glandiceps talaboti]